MLKLTSAVIAAVGASALIVAASAPADARTCINKAGQGTNTTEEGAKFQAYEAILQATDWATLPQSVLISYCSGPGMLASRIDFVRCVAGRWQSLPAIGQELRRSTAG